jgi:universal stress protein E
MGRFSNFLYVVNGSSWFREAYERALTLAARENARLTVLEVIEELPNQLAMPVNESSKDLRDITILERRAKLKKLIAPGRRKVQVELNVVCGNRFTEIFRQVLHGRHDLLILPAEPKAGLDRRTTVQLVRKCPCSFLVIRPAPHKRYSRVMAAVDPDVFDPVRNELNRKIMDIAASMARREGSELHITNAWTAPAEGLLRSRAGFISEDVGRYVRDVLRERANEVEAVLVKSNLTTLKPRVHLLKGEPTKVIPELAQRKHIDLLIMGTLSRTGIGGWLIGNTAEKILRRVDCSALVVKADARVLPLRLKQKSIDPGHRRAVGVSNHSRKRVRAN